jgi:hypothetical protein
MYKRIKKDTSWSIQDLGAFNVSAIKAEVSKFSEEWLLDTSRQDNNYTHSKTQMFRICETDYGWVPGSNLETFNVNSFKSEEANNELLDIYKKLEYYYSGKIIRCEAIKMPAMHDIPKHVDGGALLNYSRRVHVPIITNKDVFFTVMDNTVNMKEGGWYEINNQMPHSVSNKSHMDRVHLIIDILPDDMINYKIGE